MAEERVGRIYRVKSAPITNPVAAPSGPNDGVECGEFTWCLLRIKASVNVAYSLEVYTFEDHGVGNDWIEDPSERRTPNVGEDYTRYFRVRGADKIAIAYPAVAGGNITQFLSFT